MANPTVKTTIPQAANVKAALWVSPDVVGGSGAWDAKNSVRYAPWGTLSSVALGSTGINGLSAPGGTNCGIDLGLVAGHTTTPFDITGTQFSLVVCAASAGSAIHIQNRGVYTTTYGWSLGVESTSYVMARALPLTAANGGASSLTANTTTIYAITYDGANLKLYKNGTLIATQPNTASLAYDASSRRAALFNQYQTYGGNAGAQSIFGAVVYDKALTQSEVQTFGVSAAEANAGSFHAAAFDFGGSATDATANTSPVSLTLSAPVATASGTGGATNGTGTGTLQSIVLTAPAGYATGTASGSGTITTPVLKNNTGTVLASQTGITVHVYAVFSGDKVVTLTGQTTNGSGVMTLSSASIVAGTQYRVVIVLDSGAEGMEKLTAS